MFSKKKVKAQFEITIKAAQWTFGYTKLSGKVMHVEWKRGDKNKGSTKSLALEEGSDNIPFEHKIKFTETMPYDGTIEKDPKFKSKKMQLTLLVDGEKKGKELVIGKADIDLASFCMPGAFESEQKVELMGKEKKSSARNPAVMLDISVEWLKVNGKKVTSDSGSSKKKSGKSSSKSDSSAASDDPFGLDDLDGIGLGKKNTKFKSMKKNKTKSPEEMLGEPESISVGGRELTLEEPDPDEMSISEAESNWDGDETDRDYLDDDEDWADELAAEGDKAFADEEAKDSKNNKKGGSTANSKKANKDDLDEFGLGGGSFGKRNKGSDSGSSFGRRKDDRGSESGEGSDDDRKADDDALLDDDNDGIMDSDDDLEDDTSKKTAPKKDPEPVFTSSFQRTAPVALPGLAKDKDDKKSPRDSESKSDNLTKWGTSKKEEPKKETKEPAKKVPGVTVITPAGSKRAAVSAKKDSGEISDLQNRINVLEAKMESRDAIETYIYHCAWDYDREGLSTSATKMSSFLTQETRVFDKVSQFDEENQYTLQQVLSALYGQYCRFPDDLSHIVGWLQYSASLVTAILRATPADQFTPEGKGAKDELSPKWCLTWAKTGVITRFNTVKSAQDSMSDLDVEEEFTGLAQDLGSPSIAFMQIIDQMISHCYGMACSALRKRLAEEGHIDDVLFDADHISSSTKKKAKALKKQGKIMHELDSFISTSKSHKLPKAVEMQILGQAFSLTNAALVNSLLSTSSLCRASSALCLRSSLSHIEEWLAKMYAPGASSVKSPSSSDSRTPAPSHVFPWLNSQFDTIRECANLLQIDKGALAASPTELIGSVFVCLNAAQIARILQQFKPDEFASEPVPDGALRGFQSASSSSKDNKVQMDTGFILRIPPPGK